MKLALSVLGFFACFGVLCRAMSASAGGWGLAFAGLFATACVADAAWRSRPGVTHGSGSDEGMAG